MKIFILEAPFYVDKLLEITLLKLKFKRDKDLREKLIEKFTKGMCKLSKTLTKIGLANMSIIIIEKIIPGLIEKYPIYSKIIEEIVAAIIG